MRQDQTCRQDKVHYAEKASNVLPCLALPRSPRPPSPPHRYSPCKTKREAVSARVVMCNLKKKHPIKVVQQVWKKQPLCNLLVISHALRKKEKKNEDSPINLRVTDGVLPKPNRDVSERRWRRRARRRPGSGPALSKQSDGRRLVTSEGNVTAWLDTNPPPRSTSTLSTTPPPLMPHPAAPPRGVIYTRRLTAA